ncbi:DUF4350 domain-containing protein [Halomarina oriensis]|uniref:Thermonuclease family protein n=1 Tax=Halomarina oriensis TaxID=671145 RepID=A0A6B0GLL6_9EURY|nr:DUF4350 domain-containing protein [Halomarina oriensis]MWG35644.1 thermonuclease family protein [Halomarina oriensis]
MRRRTFLTALGATGAATLGATTVPTAFAQSADVIQPLMFDSTASILDADGEPLTDDSVVAMWAEPTAFNVNEDGNANDGFVEYPDGTPIPLVTSAGGVVGFGAPIGQNDTNFNYGNEEFLLNVLDAETGGSGTIAFDFGHDQFYGPWRFEAFLGYAEDNGYDVNWTETLAADLPDADVAVVTSPSEAFTAAELDAVASFVDDGGTLLLFDQSDFRNFDATDNSNEIAAAVDAPFRFNDDQVLDAENNVGPDFIPVTSNFNTTAFDYFTDRDGLGFELDREATYAVDVVEVTDGDTVDVEFEGGQEEAIRVLGIDTPEKPSAAFAERTQEWEGIESLDYLQEQGLAATEYAQGELTPGDTVDLTFDENEPVRDEFGRVLGYLTYDADDSGSRDTLYNRQVVADGFARVYDSGLGRHDALLAAEFEARAARKGLWAGSELPAPEIRNDDVESLFFPRAASVESSTGRLDKRVPVRSSESASTPNAPLVGIDQHARVAMVGSPFVDESYEAEEDYPVDTSEYGNFAFLTNLADRLSAREGVPVIDGGHGQFGAGYALSAEDAAYYKRYLEGVGLGLQGVNDIDEGFGAELLSRASVYVLTAPAEPLSEAELAALQSFRDDGGAVLLLGGDVPQSARENLNAVAEALCTDLRLGAAVTDATNNVNEDPSVVTTSAFDTWFRLFDAYDAQTEYKGARGGPGVPGCQGRRNGASNGNGNANGKGKKKGHGKR